MTETTDSHKWSWSARLFVMSLAASVAVSVIYLPQTLLINVARDLGVTPVAAGAAATAVQAGYGIGIFLLVPLADRINPRSQVTVQTIALAAALALTAILPTVASVAVGFLIVGLVANIAPILIPVASRLAPPGRAGSSTGALVGALLVGIFGGRILASILVQVINWRLVVVVFAVLVLVTLPALRRSLPLEFTPIGERKRYGRLLLSTLTLPSKSSHLAPAMIIQFFVFGTFISFWTVMVLHLTGPAYGWSVLGAGLFGFVPLAAGLITPFTGRLVDRFGALPVAGAFLILLLVSVATVIADADSIILFAVSMFLATWGNQSAQSALQNRVLTAIPGSAAQANTLFMACVFLGGAIGAIVGPIAFVQGGMRQVAIQGTVFIGIAVLVWLVTSWRELRQGRATVPTPAQ